MVDSLIHEAAISANYTSFYTLKYFFIMFFVSILDDTRKRDEKQKTPSAILDRKDLIYGSYTDAQAGQVLSW